RPRAGLIRVREFTMKDAYSFHTSQESLEEYYQRAHEAYEKIYRRVGMKHVVSILSNSGMMGGSISHEFMLLADCGEDSIVLSPDGKSYKANREVAVSGLKFEKTEAELPLEKVATPDAKTIDPNINALPSTSSCQNIPLKGWLSGNFSGFRVTNSAELALSPPLSL
ncbi:MAG: hypothetical protein J6K89_05325, partial [Oscillospiraceae bacterium]|nr:hypothetical protein [Oscillospiraceae bacterium]